MNDKCKFYLILCIELVFLPFLWLGDMARRYFSRADKVTKQRLDVASSIINVGVHEWGGYGLERTKTIKNGTTFECGLRYQIERFTQHKNVEMVVTMSDSEKYRDMEYVRQRVSNIVETDNCGMDFSGYAAVYESLKNKENRYVILSNSSVNAIQEEFLDGYIEYMNQNLDVGMLGVSYCTKMIQTLVRDNFTPHLQSFFLLTTTDVLRQVVELNGGKFPGQGVNHKLLLIRRGEIRMSELVQKAGYRLCVINPNNGEPYKFERYSSWKLPMGDIRQKIKTPNRITPITI